MAESIRQIWSKKTGTVLGGATKVVDLIALSAFTRLEYIVEMRDTTSSKTKGFKFSVQKDDTGLNDTLFDIIGSPINIEFSANVNGLDCEIELINNETFNLALSFVRLKL